MAIGSEQIPYKVGIGIMYTLNVFALILTSEALILKDYRLGFLEQFYLLGSDISWVITAKYFSHLLICIFISLITLPLFSLWLNIKSSDLLLIGLATILLDTVVLLSILFASCLLLGSKANILLSIIALIFILPALIFATLSIDNLGFLGLLVALFLFLGPIITIAVKHLIIIALEDRN
jgi:heme exporter protein B